MRGFGTERNQRGKISERKVIIEEASERLCAFSQWKQEKGVEPGLYTCPLGGGVNKPHPPFEAPA